MLIVLPTADNATDLAERLAGHELSQHYPPVRVVRTGYARGRAVRRGVKLGDWSSRPHDARHYDHLVQLAVSVIRDDVGAWAPHFDIELSGRVVYALPDGEDGCELFDESPWNADVEQALKFQLPVVDEPSQLG